MSWLTRDYAQAAWALHALLDGNTDRAQDSIARIRPHMLAHIHRAAAQLADLLDQQIALHAPPPRGAPSPNDPGSADADVRRPPRGEGDLR